MKAREKRIRILNLQDQYCQRCAYRIKSLTDCVPCCEIGGILNELARGLIQDEGRKVLKTSEEWDEICGQAVILYEQGLGFTIIAKRLGYPTSTLRDQLKKRGMWKGKTQAEIQEHSRNKWDQWCQKAQKIREQGLSYEKIARYLGVPASNLRYQMNKRGIR